VTRPRFEGDGRDRLIRQGKDNTPILHDMLKTATKSVSRTIGKSGFGFYMCKIKVIHR
jgi:hypothetical protein